MMKIDRFDKNPILTPEDVKPSSAEMTVVGVFNCGAVKYKEQTILLCRVAENVKVEENCLRIPVMKEESRYRDLCFEVYRKDDGNFNYDDSRSIKRADTGRIERLTSFSHFRIARSFDGVNFEIDQYPCISPQGRSEEWGMEDPRITAIGSDFFITYSSISSDGVSVSLLKTSDFIKFERIGVILPPTNKDAVLFPEKINGEYRMLHRPVPSEIGKLNIWMSSSKDLRAWGEHKCIYRAGTGGSWESDRVGGGPPPFLTEKGWLFFYHGVDEHDRYSMGALLLERDEPEKVIAGTHKPIMVPEQKYERTGFFPNVVFPCGIIEVPGGVRLYYGAADECICTAVIEWKDLWEALNA